MFRPTLVNRSSMFVCCVHFTKVFVNVHWWCSNTRNVVSFTASISSLKKAITTLGTWLPRKLLNCPIAFGWYPSCSGRIICNGCHLELFNGIFAIFAIKEFEKNYKFVGRYNLTFSQVVDQASVYDTDLTLVQFSAYLELFHHRPGDIGCFRDFADSVFE